MGFILSALGGFGAMEVKMSVSAISSAATIGAIGGAAPVTPTRAVDKVVKRRKSANGEREDAKGGFDAAPSSPAASSSNAVLTALISLNHGG